ncbi:MAG TPA: adenylate/guanylate cyclase domain-containing protein [Polyangia bacterium]|nr:adenylate/guanylate cyclase domain-containing protein [Polyangia bacterium]
MNERRVWLVQLPLVLVWTVAFLIAQRGDARTLASAALRARVYPTLRMMEGFATDLKFRLRGPRPLAPKIVMVEIDEDAINQLGRWPWHRDAMAVLIQSVFDAGAKVVGLDIVFSEPDVRVPEGVGELLRGHGLGDQIPTFETDLTLQRIIALHRDRLVLGWMSDDDCVPAWESCDRMLPLPAGFAKFALDHVSGGLRQDATALVTVPTITANIDGFDDAAAHSGYFLGWPDPDDVTRRAFLTVTSNGRLFPSLPLEMARVGTRDDVAVTLDGRGEIASLALTRAGERLPVSKHGLMPINFLGPGYQQGAFPWVPAMQVIGDNDTIEFLRGGKVEAQSRKQLFQDAYVFIGLTAEGVNDLRNFPFATHGPGVEGHATVLENILSQRFLRTGAGLCDGRLVLALMTLGALLFGWAMVRVAALPALLLSIAVIGALALIDVSLFSRRNLDLDSVFLFGELLTIFVATLAVKYVQEERGKQLIRGTFSKYLAPAVVDQMLKDPGNVQLGGETRKLTIMMSDLRGFTATAERLQPEQVLGLLNNYLGTMADIIVDHQGTIDEFIGDAILVIFGAPLARPDDARRAVACAVAMQRAMRGINEHNARLGLPAIEMGIALNTGEVIVGNIGSQKHIKYGVVGSHVNLTARIESNTVGGQVLISGTTLELAGADVKLGEKQMIVAKGFPQPIPAFEVRGIGGEYDLMLDEVDLALVTLTQPLDVRFRIMKSKNEEGDEQAGRFTALSTTGAVLVTERPLDAFWNLRIKVLAPSGTPLEGDLYAKALASGATCQLRFTALPPDVQRLVEQQLALEVPERSSDLAERS